MCEKREFDIHIKVTIWNRKHTRVRNYFYDKVRVSGIDEEDALKNSKITDTILRVCEVKGQ